jgi:hypothetical protein
MGEPAMKVRYVGGTGKSQERQDMCFTLRHPALPQVVKVKTNPVGGAVYWMNKSQWHRLKAASDPAQSMKLELGH